MYNKDKKININGYIAYYYPEHPKAYSNGCVYEHILVAEQILGRFLNSEECVHHIDFDRANNKASNLMIFATKSDHTAFHQGVKAVLSENGTYICPDKTIKIKSDRKDVCPICGINLKSSTSNMCLDCYNIERTKNIPSKNVLIKLKETLTNIKIAELYNVSDRAVGKWLAKYNIPSKIKKT